VRVFLHFLSGTRQDQVLEVDLPEGRVFKIGRDPASDLPFSLDFEYPVSRHHATLENKGGKVVLRDVGSSLGTTVQGQKIDPAKGVVLKSTYRLQFGGEVGPLCRFYLEQDLKRCPLCQGPLFKSNFTCVFCQQKVCFTHFDETFKCCSACADGKRRALLAAGALPQAAPYAAARYPPGLYPPGAAHGANHPSSAATTPAFAPLADGGEPSAPARTADPRKRTVVANTVCERCGCPTRAGESFCIGCRR
jgi:hypothetical protein